MAKLRLQISRMGEKIRTIKVNLLLGLIGFFSFSITAQTVTTDSVSRTSVKQKVFLEHADILSFNKAYNPDAQILTGNVCFRHDSSYMYCDSANFYEKDNSFEAFNHVRMEQGDTLFVYGDYLNYNGNTRVAKLRNHVRLENLAVTLFTDSLNYNRNTNIAYYLEGGLIVDEENELSSYYGQYSPDSKQAIFKDSVLLLNTNFTLNSDTLLYRTDIHLATLLGQSVIQSDSSTIYSTRGWYDTDKRESSLLDHSLVISGNDFLTGDSIHYDENLGLCKVYGTMQVKDTLKKIAIEGNIGYYDQLNSYAFATDSARILEFSQGDTLFAHADSVIMLKDSLTNRLKAFHGVRFYRTDLQGTCDSLQFLSADSTLYMYDDPILWNENYQLQGDSIDIVMNDSTIDHAIIKGNAFAVQHLDSSYYNQLKGGELKAFFKGQTLERIEITGNAESIFFPIQGNGSMVGMNQTKSGFLTIWVNNNKLERLKIWPSPEGTLTPIPDLTPQMKFLKDFVWLDYIRPLSKDDIYTVRKRKVPKKANHNNKFVY